MNYLDLTAVSKYTVLVMGIDVFTLTLFKPFSIVQFLSKSAIFSCLQFSQWSYCYKCKYKLSYLVAYKSFQNLIWYKIWKFNGIFSLLFLFIFIHFLFDIDFPHFAYRIFPYLSSLYLWLILGGLTIKTKWAIQEVDS